MTIFRGRASETPLPPQVAAAIADLQQLAQMRPALAGHAQTLAWCLPTIVADLEPAPAWSLSAERIVSKYAAGEPLLRGETAPFDPVMFKRRWGSLTGLLSEYVGRNLTTSLARAVVEGDLQLQEMTAWVLAGRIDALRARAAELGLDVALTATVLRWTLFAPLNHLQARLAPALPNTPWPHGYCAICGSWPLLGEFRGLEQVRYLRCGLCAMSWEFSRLKCPFCGNDDHRQLGFLHQEGEEGKLRVATCDACRGYVKMVATLAPLEPVRLLVMEVATLPLDLAAAAREYAVP